MKTSPLFFQRLLQAAGRAAGRAVGWAQQGDVPWTWVLLALAAVSPRRSLRLALGAAKATVPLALATAAASAVSEGFRRALYFHARVVPLIASYRLVDLATRRKAADVRAARYAALHARAAGVLLETLRRLRGGYVKVGGAALMRAKGACIGGGERGRPPQGVAASWG